jgi:soluble lytic murein transglycosylase
LQAAIIRQYGQVISMRSQNARLDNLIKNESYTQARALGGILQRGYPQLIEARIALREDKRGSEDLVYKVPSSLQNNTGLLFERIRTLRKNDNNAAAANLLNKASALDGITFPEDWWKERNILVRRLIEDRNFPKAYALASNHGLEKGPEFAEAEWLSGWLALRFLNKPQVAYTHFMNMYGKVETAISKARGAYWAARAAETLNKDSDANTWYFQAATYPHTYYGQIALNHLKMPAPQQLPLPATANDQAAITSSDLVQAAVLLHNAGYESLSAKFISAKLDNIQVDGGYQAFATYLNRIGDVSGAYRVAKRASWKNIFLGDTAYPSLMKWVDDASIDPALAHAIIRQESQFDTSATSPSGALGLMQLMPGTASEVARKRGWAHQTAWLISKPDHNILLGSTYLNELLRRFNGSYPLAIAAYNAGPSRVNGWLEAFGDPRTGEVNWIDWLELIPIPETRNYVQRVTEGIVTYRDHLGMIKK